MRRSEGILYRTCRCGNQFTTGKEKQVYCSARCRYQAYRDSRVEITPEEYREYLSLKELIARGALNPAFLPQQ